ncbi:MAG TPA: GAF and ANTAR domain-containing protein [Mycobacteriales bacterium]|nr:GAF and ANTAR domain-containing protein [Mycobacteriales bacterium]
MTADHLPLSDELATVYARMSGMLLSQETVQTMVELVTDLATRTISSATGCAVSLMDERGRRTTTAATNPLVTAADDMQYELDEGPCMTAWRQQAVVRVDDTASDARWPAWAERAHALDIRAALSAPLHAGGEVLGAMKVYSEQPAAFDESDEQVLIRFAAQAAIALANMQSLDSAQRLSEGLKDALSTRDVIATAKGALMAHEGVDEQTAFAMLVSASQRENVKVRDVAANLLAGLARRRR